MMGNYNSTQQSTHTNSPKVPSTPPPTLDTSSSDSDLPPLVSDVENSDKTPGDSPPRMIPPPPPLPRKNRPPVQFFCGSCPPPPRIESSPLADVSSSPFSSESEQKEDFPGILTRQKMEDALATSQENEIPTEPGAACDQKCDECPYYNVDITPPSCELEIQYLQDLTLAHLNMYTLTSTLSSEKIAETVQTALSSFLKQ